eukprot:917656-Amphidinium_carterae.1
MQPQLHLCREVRRPEAETVFTVVCPRGIEAAPEDGLLCATLPSSWEQCPENIKSQALARGGDGDEHSTHSTTSEDLDMQTCRNGTCIMCAQCGSHNTSYTVTQVGWLRAREASGSGKDPRIPSPVNRSSHDGWLGKALFSQDSIRWDWPHAVLKAHATEEHRTFPKKQKHLLDLPARADSLRAFVRTCGMGLKCGTMRLT